MGTLSQLDAPSGASEPVVATRVYSDQPFRQVPRAGLNWPEALAAYTSGVQKLFEAAPASSLLTRKALQTGKAIRFDSSTALTTQVIPDYASLPAGVADNDAFVADKAVMSTVTAVYDLTDDPTRATNLYSSFAFSLQRVTLTAATVSGHTYEVQGTYLPYQGRYTEIPNHAGVPGHMLFEILDWSAFLTSAGTAGTTTNSFGPLIARLPMPTGLTNLTFDQGEIKVASGIAESDSTYKQLILPASVRAQKSLIRGAKVALSGTAVRGGTQTTGQLQAILPAVNTKPTNYLAGYVAMVRVAEGVIDSDVFALGRLMMLVAVHNNTSAAPIAGAISSVSAVDVYALDGAPDYYEGMGTLL